MKTKEELEILAEEALKVDSERHELTQDERYYFRRGFIIAYQKLELKSDSLHDVIGRLTRLKKYDPSISFDCIELQEYEHGDLIEVNDLNHLIEVLKKENDL